jgi:uncharacterized protein (DUF433 family)
MATTQERISKTPGVCGGKACIAGHRVRVLDIVVWHEHQGMSADEIVSHVPSITLADVHAALAYYYDHLDEIQQEQGRSSDANQSSWAWGMPQIYRNSPV